jgi:hypothetical protein
VFPHIYEEDATSYGVRCNATVNKKNKTNIGTLPVNTFRKKLRKVNIREVK